MNGMGLRFCGVYNKPSEIQTAALLRLILSREILPTPSLSLVLMRHLGTRDKPIYMLLKFPNKPYMR